MHGSWTPETVWKREHFLPLTRIEPWLSEILPLIRRYVYFVIELGLRVNSLTLRLLMSYIYIYIYIYMEHPFLMFLDHTQRRSTVGRTPLDE